MKNLFLILVSSFFVVSCNSKEKFEGKWTSYFLSDYGYNESRDIAISNDSIEFNYPHFDHYNKYPLKIEKSTFKFNNIILKASIKKDTLTLNDSINFVKDDLDTLYEHKPILKIDLPLLIPNLQTLNKENYINSFVYFGKRLDNNLFSLQLNDKYADIHDLPSFLVSACGGRHRAYPINYFYIDNNTPMHYLEEIFSQLKFINHLKIAFVSEMDIKFNNTEGLYYNYQGILKKLPPIREEDINYKNSINSKITLPPPSPSLSTFNNKNLQSKFIYLKKNKIYNQDKIISTSELKKLIKLWVENNNVIFSLYDLESTYGDFLEMTAIINSVYQDVREKTSKEKFNKPLKDLTKEELREIKTKIPMCHVWSYSIPHFNHVVENNDSFFGLDVDSALNAE